MSRSRKKPWGGVTTARSEKKWKAWTHRLLRRIPDDVDLPNGNKAIRIVSNIWDGPKDGKTCHKGWVKATRK
jgi:hypothetical protein